MIHLSKICKALKLGRSEPQTWKSNYLLRENNEKSVWLNYLSSTVTSLIKCIFFSLSKNVGGHFETWNTGILGPVALHGLDQGKWDLSWQKWTYQVAYCFLKC